MPQRWFEVQSHHSQVHVARQSGSLPYTQFGEALVKIEAAGLCGTDIRFVTGNKIAYSDPNDYITLGHEGAGSIITINNQSSELQPGDYVVVLPHIHTFPTQCKNAPQCLTSGITPVCIGSGSTQHMGWDINGCFANYIAVPTTNIVHVEKKYLQFVEECAPDLGRAIFAFVEPMLCVLSAYELMEIYSQALLKGTLEKGRALVIGCGPIGILHSLTLLARGYEVWIMDTLERRAELTQWCLDYRCHVFHQSDQVRNFDIVMVTASSASAINKGEDLVRDKGILYLFAGLNTIDRSAMDSENIFFYERLHRTAKGFLTTTRFTGGDKAILYLGHSGYYERLVPEAIAAVARHVVPLNRAVTGYIPGLFSDRIVSRLPGGTDWATEDGSPAIISILNGTDLRDRHCKLLILTNWE